MKKEEGMTVISLVIIGLIIIILSIVILNVAFGESGLVLRKKKADVSMYADNMEKEISSRLKEIEKENSEKENDEDKKNYLDEVKNLVSEKEKEKKAKKLEVYMQEDEPKELNAPGLMDHEEGKGILYVIVKNNNYYEIIQVVQEGDTVAVIDTDTVRKK